METAINYCELDWAYVSSDERRWINHIRKLANARPDEVVILKEPEENGGFIYAKFPPKWARILPPREMNLSNEERARRAEKLRHSIASRTSTQDGDDGDE